MTESEKEDYVEEHLLDEALKSIKTSGRYWHSSIPRVLTNALSKKLREAGYPVIVREIPPQWEHVFYLEKYASASNGEELELIAKKRYELMENGKSKTELPT